MMEIAGKTFCPRRRESAIGVSVDTETHQGDHWEDRQLGYLCCSYCGGMAPADFFKYVEAGHEVDPTDKNYKAYVHQVRGPGKVYFQHFSDFDQKKFIDLHNMRVMKLGAPGHFYVTPFFCGLQEKH